jgi:hypothetical protein
MTYLFKPYDGEVKNDSGNPLPISKNTSLNSETNKIFVDTGLTIATSVTVSNLADVPVFNGEIKNDAGNPISISKNTTTNSAENPIYVDTGLTIPPAFDGEIKNDAGNPIPISKNTTANSSSNPLAVEWVYGSGASLIPWEVQVARNKIAGVTGLSISGYQHAVPDSWVPIWEYATPYTYFGTAQQVRIWSSSASDTNVSVLITGVDSNYAELTETVVLTNGATGVLSTNSFLRVNNLSLTRLPMNVGNISAGNTGKTITLATIMPDSGRSQMTIYTVPAGYTFYLTQANVYTNQVGSQTGLYRSYTKSPAGVINAILQFPFTDSYLSRKVVPRGYPEKTDIQWQVQSSQGTSRIGGQIEGYLISNSAL